MPGIGIYGNPLAPENKNSARFAVMFKKLVNPANGNVIISGTEANEFYIGDGEAGDKYIFFNIGGITADNPGFMWDQSEEKLFFSVDGTNWYQIKYYTYGDGIEITDNPDGCQGTISVDLATASGLKFSSGKLQIALRTTSPCLEIEDEGGLGLNYVLDVKDLGGDLSGTVINGTVAKIQGKAVSSTAPTDGQLLQWVAGSSQWVPTTVSFTSAFTGLTDCPSSYSGKAGNLPIVKSTVDGLEFASLDSNNANGEVKFDYDTTNKIIGGELNIAVGSAGFYSDRKYYQAITVDHTKVSGAGTITGYMLKIVITDSGNGVFAKAQSNGDDIVFTDTSNNLLPFRIVKYDPVNYIFVAWVLTDVSSLSDTTIRMYYGSTIATSEANVSGVTAGYEAIFPLNGDIDDYGSRGKNGTNVNSTEDTSGKILSGRSFVGEGTQYFHLGKDGFRITQFGEGTVGFWCKHTGTGRMDIMGVVNDGTNEMFEITVNVDSSYVADSNKLAFVVRDTNAKDIQVGLTGDHAGLNDGNWHHVVVRWKYNSSANSYNIFIDGVSKPVTASINEKATFATGLTLWDYNFCVGVSNIRGSYTYPYTGSLDEVWMYNGNLSDSYIITLYNNENDPSTFFSLGTEQDGDYKNGQELFDEYIEFAKNHADTEDAINGLVKVDGAGGYSAVTDNSTNWNTAYTNRVDTWTSPLQCSSNTASILDATTSQKGAVQLQDSIDSTTTKAVTPNAVMTYARPLTYPMGRYYLSSGQTIPDSSWTTLQLAKDWEINSGDGGWDAGNYRFVVPTGQSGYYNVVINSLWSSLNPGGTCRIAIYWYDYSASTWAYKSYAHSYQTASKNLELNLNDIIQADAGDYIQIRVYHNSGSDATVSGSGDKFYTSATITRVA